MYGVLVTQIAYINQPPEPVLGLSNVRKIIKGILDLTHKVEWKLSNVFSRGNTVCIERLDCWDFDGKGRGRKPGRKVALRGDARPR